MDVEDEQAELDLDIPSEEDKIDILNNPNADESIFSKFQNEIRASPAK